MRGIILAGGLGTRLRPLTLITNKHLLPVYNKPMILYPLETLRNSGVKDILIVCGEEYVDSFVKFLGSGKEYGANISYTIQQGNGGIPDALRHAKDFAGGRDVAVILGDNVFGGNFKKNFSAFKGGAMIFLKKVNDPERFGVAVFDKNKKKVIKIEEKPKNPKSNLIKTGLYIFDKNVFDIIDTLKPSLRGETEITDVVNTYIQKGNINFSLVRGFWSDAGTIHSLLQTSIWVAKKGL